MDSAVDAAAFPMACKKMNMVLIHLRTSNVQVPRDVKIVSYYDNILLENNIPSITSLHFDAA